METLVHLVVSQDHTIRQQLQRMRELDRDIERYEAKVHLERVQRHGLNYVQDTYLQDAVDSGSAQERRSVQDVLVQFEQYALCCEELVRVQDELTEREELVDRITAEIQEELNQRWMERRREEASGESSGEQKAEEVSACETAEADCQSVDELALEEERIRTQLDTSLYIGLRLKTDLDSTRSQLDSSLVQWQRREQDLLELLDLLAREDSVEDPQDTEEGADGTEGTMEPGAEPWVEQARGLSKSCTNDEDSDTGLSSMHSQDSDHTPVCESLV